MGIAEIREAPTVVIIGAGFGGVEAAKALAACPVRVVLIDRNNYQVFQPLLYQVATTAIQPEDIIYPVRALLRGQKNLEFLLAEVQDFDLNNHMVLTSNGTIPYDYLVVAAGGMTNFFGLNSAAANGFGLKSLEEAVALRNHMLTMVERAVWEPTEMARKAMLTFVVVGGGPTGVETAGAISELMHRVLPKDYPGFDSQEVRVVLLEACNSLLTNMPEKLRNVTATRLTAKQVEVCFGAQVVDYNGEQVSLRSGEIIPTKTLIWAAGVQAAGIVGKMGLKLGSMRRIVVTSSLQVEEHPDIFVVGDAAHCEENGKPLPMIAPVAMQQAKTAAANIALLLKGQPPRAFVNKDMGSLAIIGRNDAVARMGSLAFSGFFAWTFWLLVHVVRNPGFRHRILLIVNWLWDYFFNERASRVIAQEVKEPAK